MKQKWVVLMESGYRTFNFVFDSMAEAARFMQTAVERSVPYADKYDSEPYIPQISLRPLYEAMENVTIESEEE